MIDREESYHLACRTYLATHGETRDFPESMRAAVEAILPTATDGREPGSASTCSLRDYFAGQALPAIITSKLWGEAAVRAAGVPRDLDDTLARKAYQLADAMLKAREEGK